MAVSRPQRLRVGVVGLGRLWEARHKPAFLQLSDRFRVVSVYDQVFRRAELEAESIGAVASESLAGLIESPNVDVVSILTPQWFGIHAIEVACQVGKPIYCALPLDAPVEQIATLDRLIKQNHVAFVPELARRFYPATLRLKELLATTLGPARLIQGHVRLFGFDRYSQPGPATQVAPAALLTDPGGYLIDWCRFIFQAEPLSVHSSGTAVLPGSEPGNDFESFVAHFPDGVMAQISIGRYNLRTWGEAGRFLPQPGFQVYAERGVAWLEMPDKIQWSDTSGLHDERLALEPSVGEILNLELYQVVQGEASTAPTWDDARLAALLVEDLKKSQNEGRRIWSQT